MYKNIFLILAIAIGSAVCYPNDIIKQCTKTDEACIRSSAKHALVKIFSGIPELNVEPSDPLHLDQIHGDLSTLKYTFTDVTSTGFKNCDISNIKLDLEEPLLRFNLTCPDIIVTGNYKISGRLIILPIEGEGPFKIHIKKYQIGLVSTPKISEGKDGKQHISVKKYQAYGDPQEGIHYDLQNLFGGQKELGDEVLKFANENWKEVADFVQGPVFHETVKKIVTNVNKFFKAVPLEDYYAA